MSRRERTSSPPATVTERYEAAVLAALRDFFLTLLGGGVALHLLAGDFAATNPGISVLLAALPSIVLAARRFYRERPTDTV